MYHSWVVIHGKSLSNLRDYYRLSHELPRTGFGALWLRESLWTVRRLQKNIFSWLVVPAPITCCTLRKRRLIFYSYFDRFLASLSFYFRSTDRGISVSTIHLPTWSLRQMFTFSFVQNSTQTLILSHWHWHWLRQRCSKEKRMCFSIDLCSHCGSTLRVGRVAAKAKVSQFKSFDLLRLSKGFCVQKCQHFTFRFVQVTLLLLLLLRTIHLFTLFIYPDVMVRRFQDTKTSSETITHTISIRIHAPIELAATMSGFNRRRSELCPLFPANWSRYSYGTSHDPRLELPTRLLKRLAFTKTNDTSIFKDVWES